MKKNLHSVLAAIVIFISSLSFAQGTGNQPSGNLVIGSDGYIYGVYTTTTSTGSRPSTIYRHLPGSTTIDPVYRFNDAVVEIYSIDKEGLIYGTAIQYDSDNQPLVSTVFRVRNDGTNYSVFNTNNAATKGIHTSITLTASAWQLYCVRSKHDRWTNGILFTMGSYGGGYDVTGAFENQHEYPSSLLPFRDTLRWEYADGSPASEQIEGIWLATSAGGTFGKGSIRARGYYNEELVPVVNFTGTGGGAMDGEGPVGMAVDHDNGIYAVTHRGGVNNEGAIFTASPDSVYKLYDFNAPYGRPFGKPFVDFDSEKIVGLGGDFDNNTGFIYSYNLQTSALNTIASFDGSTAVNGVTSVVSHNGVIYGTSRTSGSDSDNGSFFSIGDDGMNTQIIFKFVDGYSRLIEPNYTRTEASVTPSLQADNGVNASSYRIEVSENSDFTGNVHVVNSTDGLGKINPPGLKYATQYYARVKTNLIDDYGTVTTFTTHAPEKYSFVSYPINPALNGMKLNANIVYGATIYTIEINTSADFTGTSIVRTSAVPNQRMMTFDGLQPGTTYYARTKTNYPSDWGPVRSFTTPGIAPPPMFIAETTELKVYPNPFERNFTIEPFESQELNITLVDLTGRELVKSHVIQQRATLGDQLAPGIYVLRITEKDGKSSVRRLVKKQ